MRETFISRVYAKEIRRLMERVSRGLLATATLLVGPPLTGKTEILQHIARPLLCRERRACGVCESCQRQLPTHPDVLMADDAAAHSRELLAALLQRTHERPLLAPTLVVFLWHLDRYTREALSLLLKSIEDAPRSVLFLMTADILDSVPETVRSRSAIQEIPPLSPRVLAGELENLEIPRDECKVLARLSGGRPKLAVRLFEEPDLRARYGKWWKALEELQDQAYTTRALFAQACASKEDAEELLTLYQSFLRSRLEERYQSPAVAALLRRSREAVAMVRANVPPALALEFLFFTPALP